MPGVGKEVNKCSEFIYRGAEAARKLSLEKVATFEDYSNECLISRTSGPGFRFTH